jgi:RimJ/RimL family protein N-acetyltransferase
MNVSLKPLEDRDLDTIYQQVTDPESIRMAAFTAEDQPEVTYWVDRTQWGKGIASAALPILLAETAERPLYARAASDNVGSLRVLEKAGVPTRRRQPRPRTRSR